MPTKNKNFRPVDPTKSPRFSDIPTFNRLPYIPDIRGKGIDVALIGVPFDGGTTYRPGARFGPRAVREVSVLNRNFNPALGVSVYDRLNVVDAGDIEVNPINLEKTLKGIEARIVDIHQAGSRSICIGGDHTILLGELRAVHRKYKDITLIHFDAHTDTGDQAWGEKYHHGTPIRRAIEEGLIQGSRIFQIGIRGPLSSPEQEDYLKSKKISVLDIDSYSDPKKRASFFEKIRKTAGKGPCFISFDVDGVDPAFAPGTGTPVVGGLTSREALDSVRRLKGLQIVGADIVEISPPYDHANITALLGATLAFEFLSLMA